MISEAKPERDQIGAARFRGRFRVIALGKIHPLVQRDIFLDVLLWLAHRPATYGNRGKRPLNDMAAMDGRSTRHFLKSTYLISIRLRTLKRSVSY